MQCYPLHGLTTLNRNSIAIKSTFISNFGLMWRIFERACATQCHLETSSVYHYFNSPIKHS